MDIRPLARAAAMAILVAACSAPPPPANEAGMGLPQQLAGETYPGVRRDLLGEVQVTDTGCIEVVVDGAPRFAIWPAGSQLDDVVRLPDGDVLRPGDTVTGTGALVATAPLTANRDGYWASTIGFCAPEAQQVVVFDTAQRVDPPG